MTVHHTTDDLYLAAYLLWRGCQLQGISKVGNNFCTFVFTHKTIHEIVNDWNAYVPLKVSPKALAESRRHLKNKLKYMEVELGKS